MSYFLVPAPMSDAPMRLLPAPQALAPWPTPTRRESSWGKKAAGTSLEHTLRDVSFFFFARRLLEVQTVKRAEKSEEPP